MKISKWLLLSLLCSTRVLALSIDHPVTFNDDTLGIYSKENFKKDWDMNPNASSGQSSHRLNIVSDRDDPNNHVLEVTYNANQVGGNSAMVFTPSLNGTYDHLIFQYKVKFADDFTWIKGGKLPGLTSSPDSPTGCIDNDTFDGFSARYMWRGEGVLRGYVYSPEKKERCGDYYDSNPMFYFNKGVWYTLKQEVFLGTPGERNGYIKAWIDGQPILSVTNLMLRRNASVMIDQVKMDTFFGGSSNEWAPTTNQHVYFNDFEIRQP
ncbi:MAG: hypothetical protein NXI01_00690 [Gammaproteobacteria bacterium]|nr:hypothetical protein [Gammaproteobacteria bacterium]